MNLFGSTADSEAAIDFSEAVLRISEIDASSIHAILQRYGLQLHWVDINAAIPGSFWGEPEAGVIANTVYVRDDTPVHSFLHEACHLIVADPERRANIHTDASDSLLEEDASCYLQIVLADQLLDVGSTRLMQDMDAWGYSFRLGSTRTWFEQDAEDVRSWLLERGLL